MYHYIFGFKFFFVYSFYNILKTVYDMSLRLNMALSVPDRLFPQPPSIQTQRGYD